MAAYRTTAALHPHRLFTMLALVLTAATTGCKHGGKMEPSVTTPLDFGQVLVWQSSTAQSAQWRNTGSQAVEVDAVRINPGEHFLDATTGFVAASVAPNGLSPSVSILFRPGNVGRIDGTARPWGLAWMQLPEADRPDVTDISLTGEGLAQMKRGSVELTGGDIRPGRWLNFREVETGTRGGPLTFDIRNDDPANPVTLTPAWSRGDQGFEVTAPAGDITVPAGGTVTVTIHFTPAAVENYSDSIVFTDPSGAHSAGAAVKGKGIRSE